MSSRTYREFKYTNSDGDEGFVDVGWGPWGYAEDGLLDVVDDAPIMITFSDAPWMGIETAKDFLRWFKVAISEAERKHEQTNSKA